MRGKKSSIAKNIIGYGIVLIFGISFLYFGNQMSTGAFDLFNQDEIGETAEATVTRVIGVSEVECEWFEMRILTFEARLLGEDNRPITGEQAFANPLDDFTREVRAGDRIIVFSPIEGEWHFNGFVRINGILILGGIFLVLLLIFGRVKGLSAILSLGLTCVAIFTVFIPAILTGRNIYLSAIVICTFSIIVTLFLLNGINKKSFSAVIGCFGGVVIAGLLTLFMSRFLPLTGIVDGDSISLLNLPTENPIDLKGIIFAGIIIGAVGAIMDVAVSISSAMGELKEQAPNLTFREMYKSGINIGRDIMGSMTNTLVLAYIGSSLSLILILIVHSSSLAELLSKEFIIVEILQALVGSMGILMTIPLTAAFCALFFGKKEGDYDDEMVIGDVREDDLRQELAKNKMTRQERKKASSDSERASHKYDDLRMKD